MKTVRNYVERKQTEFRKHTFFTFFKEPFVDMLPEKLVDFAPKMTFWIMCFQDVLRLNAVHITHPVFYQVARIHQVEDAGHEKWFLNDLNRLGCGVPNLQTLYSQESAPVRYASYALVSEVFRANNDFERIALLLSLESSAQVFFEHIATFSESIGYSNFLEYFSNHHLNAEQSHESFNQEIEAQIDNIQLTPEQQQGVFESIDRVFLSFTAMFNELQKTLRQNQVETSVS